MLLVVWTLISCDASKVTGPSSDGTTLVPATYEVVNAPLTSGLAVGTTLAVAPAVKVTTAVGLPVPGIALSFAVDSGGGQVTGGTVVTGADGVAQIGRWTLGTAAGRQVLVVRAGSATGTVLLRIGLSAGPAAPAKLVMATQPVSSGVVGVPLTTQPVVHVVDMYGNLVTTPGRGSIPVTATVTSGVLSGTTIINSVDGVATFSGLVAGGALGERPAIRFSADGLGVALSTALAAFSTVGAPASVVAAGETKFPGTASNPLPGPLPSVRVSDLGGNAISGVTVTFATTGGGGSVTGANAVSNASGVATVGSWTLGPTAVANTMTATVGALPPVTFIASSAIGIASGLGVSTQPVGGVVSGAALSTQPSVRVEDGLGNIVLASGVVVTASVSSGTLTGTLTATTKNGVATFTNLAVAGKIGSTRTLVFTAPALDSATSDTLRAITTAGPAASLSATLGAGQTGTAGLPLPVAPGVTVLDAGGNPVSGVPVSFAVTSGAGSATGLAQTSDSSGVAVVGSWTLGPKAGTNTLTVTSIGLKSIAITATGVVGVPGRLALVTSPAASGVSGALLTMQPVVRVEDAKGNLVPANGTVVTVSASSGSLGGTLTATTTNGIATFTNLTRRGPVGTGAVLTFSASGITPVSSAALTTVKTPGGPAAVAISAGSGQSATVGTAVPVAPAVSVTDSSGNPVAGAQVTFAVAGGGGSVAPAVLVSTNASGVATVGSWALGATVGANALVATVGGLSPVTFTATSVVGTGNRIAITTMPVALGTSGALLSKQPVVRLEDAKGNLVATSGVSVTVSASTGMLAGTTTVTTTNGVAIFTNVARRGMVGSNATLSFSSPGYTGVGSSPIGAVTVAGLATTITATAGLGQQATVSTAVANAPAVTVTDTMGNPVSGKAVTFAVTGGGGAVLPGSVSTDAAGVASATSWTLGAVAGTNTVTATAASVGTVSFSATGAIGSASKLALVTAPVGSSASGSPLTTQPVVRIVDGGGNLVPTSGVSVTAAVSVGTLTGTTTVTTTNGVASFTNLARRAAVGTNATLSFSATGLTGVASGVVGTISTAGAPATIVATAGSGQTATVGTNVATDPSVTVTDAAGNVVSGVPVTFAVSAGGGSVTPAVVVNTNASGVAVVGGWTLGAVAGANILTATAGGLPAVSFSATGVVAAASRLVIQTAPVGNALSGGPFAAQPVVRLEDANGNLVPTNGTLVTATVSAGSLTGTTSISTASGVATFTNLARRGLVSSNATLTFSAAGLSAVVSSPIGTITTAGAAASVTASAGTSQSVTAGTAVPTPPQVTVTDAAGNPVAGATVTFAVASGGGSATSLAVATNASGIAAVGSWTLGATAGANSLTATVGGLSPVTFTATGVVGTPNRLAIVVAPVGVGTSGALLSTQPSVRIEDANGNLVATTGVGVTVTAGSGALSGTTTVATTNGVAAFTNLAVSGSIGSTRTLTFSAAGITGVTSASLTAVTTAGAPASVVPLQGAGQSATVATAVATPPAVTVTDAAGNPVSGHPVMFAVTAGGGSVTGSSASTDASGVATLGSWTLGATAGSNSISATASGLSAVGFTATGTVGAAAQLGIMTAPVSGGTSEALLTTQPVVRLEDVHGNPITTSGVSVTVAISSGSVTGTTTITTTNGVAAFVNLSVSGVLGATPTLTFSSAGLASVTSPALAAFATAGAPYLISVTSGNGQSAQVNTAVAVAPTVTVTDRQGNAVSGVVVTFTPSNAGTVTPSATVTTNASGVATAGTWTLGATTGAQTLQAGANGVAPVTISATATP